jgi:hypothetical protein
MTEEVRTVMCRASDMQHGLLHAHGYSDYLGHMVTVCTLMVTPPERYVAKLRTALRARLVASDPKCGSGAATWSGGPAR